jgi:hypothetical protein
VAEESVVTTLFTFIGLLFLLFGAVAVLVVITAEKTSQVYRRHAYRSPISKLADFVIDKAWLAVLLLGVTFLFLMRSSLSAIFQ